MTTQIRSIALVAFLLILTLAPLIGCDSGEPKKAAQTSAPAGEQQTNTGSQAQVTTQGNSSVEPSLPAAVTVSFPNGAPSLNQTAKVVCTAKTGPDPSIHASLQIGLPDAFEVVSGNLAWEGDLQPNTEIILMEAVIKSVKIGNWTITVTGDDNLEEIIGGYHGGIGVNPAYVSVSEDSAQWRSYPPYGDTITPGPGDVPLLTNGPDNPPPASTTSPRSQDSKSSDPISLKLSISKLPVLNEAVDLICIVVSSRYDTANSTAHIKLPEGASLVSGNLKWQGDLKADVPATFTAKILFTEIGHWTIEGITTYSIENNVLWGGGDAMYLNVGSDHSEFGWESVPIPITTEVTKRENTTLYEDNSGPAGKLLSFNDVKKLTLPDPLPISFDDRVESNRASNVSATGITVTGDFKYWTQIGDFRGNPTTLVSAKYFLVYLYSGGGAYRGQGYTDSNGHYSISNVDPTGGLKAMFWAYVNYNGNELRVVAQGDSLAGLTDVWCTGFTDTYTFPNDGGTHYLSECIIPQGIGGDGAFWIKDDLDRAYTYVYWNSPSVVSGPCTVRWTENSNDGTYYADGGQVHLMGIDERSPDTVIHEYGHNVMHNRYGFLPPFNYGADGTHSIPRAEEPGCGWVEGWADFFPLVINGNPAFTWPQLDANGNQITLDIESPTWGTPGWDNGDAVEGRVAGGLWDIFDSTNEGYDQVSYGLDEIWQTLTTQTDNTFAEFWDQLRWAFADQTPPCRALFQSTMFPPAPNPPYEYDVRLYLTTNTIPSNGGTVSKNPSIANYQYKQQVTLTPTASTGYHFVNWTGDVPAGHGNDNPLTISMDFDKSITANFAINTLDVSVVLQGSSRPPSGWVVPLTLKLFSPGADVLNATPLYTFNLTTWKSGETAVCQATGVVPGTYDITAVSQHTLINVKRNVVISAPSISVNMGTLLEGNANDDVIIDMLDFTILAAAFMSMPGDPNWDPSADFDRNGIVDILDYSLLAGNFMESSPQMVEDNKGSGEQTFGKVDISMGAPKELVVVDDTFSVPILIDAGTQAVTGVQAFITFDPTYLKVMKIIPGDVLDLVLASKFDNSKGVITLSFARNFELAPASGQFSMGTIVFEAQKATKGTTIAFEQKPPRNTDVVFEGVSVLGDVAVLEIEIQHLDRDASISSP